MFHNLLIERETRIQKFQPKETTNRKAFSFLYKTTKRNISEKSFKIKSKLIKSIESENLQFDRNYTQANRNQPIQWDLQNKAKLVWAGFRADTDRNSTLIEKDNLSINIIFFVFASNTDIPDGKVN